MILIKHPTEDIWANLDQVKFISLNENIVDLHFDLSGFGIAFEFENNELAKKWIDNLLENSKKIKMIKDN